MGKPTGEPNKHCITGTINYIKYLVEHLSKHHDLLGRNITIDRLHSSFQAAEWLLEKKITMVDTLQQSRIGIPTVLKDIKEGELLISETYWKEVGKLNLSSYVVTTSKRRKKNIIRISALEPLHAITDGNKEKLASLQFHKRWH